MPLCGFLMKDILKIEELMDENHENWEYAYRIRYVHQDNCSRPEIKTLARFEMHRNAGIKKVHYTIHQRKGQTPWEKVEYIGTRLDRAHEKMLEMLSSEFTALCKESRPNGDKFVKEIPAEIEKRISDLPIKNSSKSPHLEMRRTESGYAKKV